MVNSNISNHDDIESPRRCHEVRTVPEKKIQDFFLLNKNIVIQTK